jgi:hypothetical protein
VVLIASDHDLLTVENRRCSKLLELEGSISTENGQKSGVEAVGYLLIASLGGEEITPVFSPQDSSETMGAFILVWCVLLHSQIRIVSKTAAVLSMLLKTTSAYSSFNTNAE